VDLLASLERFTPSDEEEALHLAHIRLFVARNRHPFDRRIAAGHLTASAFVVETSGRRVLLLHHRKLDRWLQPGGHADPDEEVGETIALREAREETGLSGLELHPSAPRPLDLDVHRIPARGDEPAHDHLDLRYLVTAPDEGVLHRNAAEAKDLKWFSWGELATLPLDSGLRRGLRKAGSFFSARPT
jgi:8-oxo-dGTP pyrophosphatase MutT (NUDIX family)